jgi:hypothetical protein
LEPRTIVGASSVGGPLAFTTFWYGAMPQRPRCRRSGGIAGGVC